MSNTSIINKLLQYHIIKFDKTKTFRLKSGNHSCLYIDFRQAISIPTIQKELCDLYCSEITKPFSTLPDYIVGVPDGAVPMAAQISAQLSIPLLMVRKQPKTHGTGNIIEGVFNNGSTVLVIEDIVTTGSSCMDVVQKLRTAGLVPIQTICLVKRSTATLGAIHGADVSKGLVPIKSLLNYKDIEFHVKLSASKLCIAVDVDTMEGLLNIIHKVYTYVSIIKIHIDMIKDFKPSGDNNSIEQLNFIKHKYGILLWEDRKFADIASVTYKQLNNSIYNITSWADIISVHFIAGPAIFKSTPYRDYFGGCKVVIIGEMSSAGTLTDSSYLEKTLDMIDPLRHQLLQPSGNITSHITTLSCNTQISSQPHNVIGVVLQSNVKTNLLKIVPGIRHDADTIKTDGSGQQYKKPSDVTWADIIVVGRGITAHIDLPDFSKIIEQYL